MTKVSLLFMFTLSMAFQINAQTYIGLMGGGSISLDEIAKGGIPAEFQIKEYLAVRIEPSFTVRQKQELIRKINHSKDIFLVRMSYLELPMMAKFSFPLEGIRPYATLGLQIGYGLKLWYNHRSDGHWQKEDFSFQLADLSRLDGGITIGAGMETHLVQKQKLFIDFRYYLGLLDIEKASNSRIYNQGLILSIGCLFPIK